MAVAIRHRKLDRELLLGEPRQRANTIERETREVAVGHSVSSRDRKGGEKKERESLRNSGDYVCVHKRLRAETIKRGEKRAREQDGMTVAIGRCVRVLELKRQRDKVKSERGQWR